MLTQPLLEKLSQLGLVGFRAALEEQLASPHYAELSFEERLGLLVDIEATRRENNRLNRRIRAARFPLQATLEDLDLSPRRGLNRGQVLQLAQSEWVAHHLNLLVLGATGAGKSFLACALGRAATQAGYKVRYERTSRFLQDLEMAHADGSYPQLLRTLARTPLLIFDDWLRDPLSRSQATDLLEVLDDRYGRSATMVVTQVPVADWHSRIPDPTLSDAILDRLIHNAYRLHLEGESMRKVHSPLPTAPN
ncbi:MAG TPA: IS21-like element helper ATPase IstB [Anaerolineales bacterium]|jgi:DNA replication protein DnaC|nr:IS21-like element helper ATPase IstB [Anaerolineales bacterium]